MLSAADETTRQNGLRTNKESQGGAKIKSATRARQRHIYISESLGGIAESPASCRLRNRQRAKRAAAISTAEVVLSQRHKTMEWHSILFCSILLMLSFDLSEVVRSEPQQVLCYDVYCLTKSDVPNSHGACTWNCMILISVDLLGLEPRTYRMLSDRSTTGAPNPLHACQK